CVPIVFGSAATAEASAISSATMGWHVAVHVRCAVVVHGCYLGRVCRVLCAAQHQLKVKLQM
ncbi:hypothetical protein, partial [Cupriavidus plantarum]|uniref:hypothetical protein n=1 Tax=Cupriavidus plantarum TaxID=942865 RepID=UPI00339D819D